MNINFYLLLSLLIIGAQSSASEVRIEVGVPSFPPYLYPNIAAGDECRGVSVKIIDLIAQQTGIEFSVVNYPYARVIKALQLKTLGAAFIFRNDSIRNDVNYLGPVSKSRVLVITANGHQPSSYQDLYSLNGIAVIRKARYNNQFDHDNKLKKVFVENYTQGFKMLRAGRVDAVIGSDLGLRYGMRKLAMDTEVLDDAFYIGDKEWWLHLSTQFNDPELLSHLQRGVDQIYQQDLAAAIFKQQLKRGCY